MSTSALPKFHDIAMAQEVSSTRQARMVIMIAILAVVAFFIFAVTTIAISNQNTATTKDLVKQSAGQRAMIFATCRAFHRRDVINETKWRMVTQVEFKYKRPNNNETDAKYHNARRVALAKAERMDAEIVRFNCIQGMERAYLDGESMPQKK